jgi:hypothetical protein
VALIFFAFYYFASHFKREREKKGRKKLQAALPLLPQ